MMGIRIDMAQSVRFFRAWLFAVGLVLCVCGSPGLASAGSDAEREYGVKAAYLYNFAKFLTWPESSFASAEEPIHICVMGRDDFGGSVDAVISGKNVRGRSLALWKLRGDGVDDRKAGSCHILFVSSSEQGRESYIFASIKGRSVVTVGEVEGFAGIGGMLNYVARGTKLRFQLNRKVAEDAGIGVSARLVKIAEIVE